MEEQDIIVTVKAPSFTRAAAETHAPTILSAEYRRSLGVSLKDPEDKERERFLGRPEVSRFVARVRLK